MGSFVERSDDLEMQTFYREKLSPFASEEIAKSDLHGKLSVIDNEQLKAFLFYKISQAIERGIMLDLEVSAQYSVSKSKIEFTDLIRVLGILLDNAIEGCMELYSKAESLTVCEYNIVIKISQNDELVSYMIKNTILPEAKEIGIKAGVSTKGKERGKGLIISRGILEKYDFITLNSYFQDDCFVQNLILYIF
jgi:two-component system sensor histidine kinase AgrC